MLFRDVLYIQNLVQKLQLPNLSIFSLPQKEVHMAINIYILFPALAPSSDKQIFFFFSIDFSILGIAYK